MNPEKTGPSENYRAGTYFRRGRAPLQAKVFDIRPWAETVIERIEKNWIISSFREMPLEGMVTISVVVEKNGELSSIEIMNSSSSKTFEEAALNALNLSTPFPVLPHDFPDKNLSVEFEFQCNEEKNLNLSSPDN